MKWQFSKLTSGESLSQSTFLAIALSVFFLGTGAFLFANTSLFKKLVTFIPLAKSDPTVDEIAAKISVKILDQEFLGSGFLVRQKDHKYLVITNQHVLRAGKAPYKIQTPDGQIHTAKVIPHPVVLDYDYDLAVLEFQSGLNYPIATIGSSLYLEVGEAVYAAGFPASDSEAETVNGNNSATVESKTRLEKLPGLALKRGRIAIILNQALVEGYQIGYTNDVKKGMSGGALLNSRGEVVGVNGKHAYPLWESPELYQDGSQPCPALEQLITRSSLAIPIEKSIELNPQLESLKSESSESIVEVSRKSNLEPEDRRLIEQMQAEAKKSSESCQKYGSDSADNSPLETIGTEN